MEQFWFLVEARSLARKCEFGRTLVEDLKDPVKNTSEVPAGEKCQISPLHYDKFAGGSFNKAAGTSYEQRPTHIA